MTLSKSILPLLVTIAAMTLGTALYADDDSHCEGSDTDSETHVGLEGSGHDSDGDSDGEDHDASEGTDNDGDCDGDENHDGGDNDESHEGDKD